MNLDTKRNWVNLRDRGLAPRISSDLVTTPEDRREFLHGAELLRIHGDTARRGQSVKPQQLLMADVMAAGHQRNAFMYPRRSSKTTSLYALGIGRAAFREDYRVGVLTMTTGKVGRSRFRKDVAPPIESLDRSDVKVYRGNGDERLEFAASGGLIAWLSTADDFRSEAFDLIILDEGGEPEPDKVSDTMAAAMPTLDTRPGAQIVVAGTAGKYRQGNLLWDWLELLRSGRIAGAEFSVDEYALSDDDWLEWEKVEPHIAGAHPGINTLTTIDAIRGNWETLKPQQFRAEYGGIFGDIGGGRALINPDHWQTAGVTGALPSPPEKFAVGFAAHVYQHASSVVAAWRDEHGRAHGGILARTKGVAGAADRMAVLVKKYGMPLGYDHASGPARVEVEKLNRMRPEPALVRFDLGMAKAAHALLVQEIDTGNLTHYQQPEMDAAAAVVVRRVVGNGWLFGRVQDEDDPTPLEAFAMALKAWDDEYGRERQALPPMFAE